MPHHLGSVPSGADEPRDPFEPGLLGDLDELEPFDEAFQPLARPSWWRWVAIAVILALVLAGPFAIMLVKLLS